MDVQRGKLLLLPECVSRHQLRSMPVCPLQPLSILSRYLKVLYLHGLSNTSLHTSFIFHFYFGYYPI